MPRKAYPCAWCGKDFYPCGRSLPAGKAMHRACRTEKAKQDHGTYACYEHGCRCAVCRGYQASTQRAFRKRYHEATGKNYRANFKYGAGRIPITREQRFAIYERDNWTCQLCHRPVDPEIDPITHPMGATLDHIIPQSNQADHSPENLRLAHRMCNSIRGNRTEFDLVGLNEALGLSA